MSHLLLLIGTSITQAIFEITNFIIFKRNTVPNIEL